ncbi:MAG: hypothetical protein LUP91_02685 [Methylococcaceae bacterium]|nr:hypothetical protein [Methylococcaceae bacterium]
MLPLCPICSGQPGLLAQHDPQMEGKGYDDCVDELARYAEAQCPTKEDKRYCDVHWIPRIAVEADDDQVGWRSPRGKRALA